MSGFHAEVHIAAPPERVWDLLLGFEGYPSWTRALALSGKAELGGPIDYAVPLARPAGPIRRLSFPATVTRLTFGRSLEWSFGMLGVIRFEISFDVEREGGGSRLRHEIQAKGVLAGVVGVRLQRLLKRPFEAFVNDVRRRLEGQAPPKPSRAAKSSLPRNLPPPKKRRRRR